MEGEAERKHQQHDGDFNIDKNDYGLFDGEQEDIIGWFDGVAESAGAVQTQTLRRVLERNCGAEYVRKWLGGVNIQDVPDSELESVYTKLVPLATHADFQPFIQRIIDGDTTPLLTQQPITSFSQTSGTSGGRPKYIPFIPYFINVFHQAGRLAEAFRSRAYPVKEGSRVLQFLYCSKHKESKGRVKVASISTHIISSKEFTTLKNEKIKSFPCSPPEVIFGEDYNESTYCHLLLGLFFSDQVEFVSSIWAYTIVQAFTAFQDLWKDLCHDIRVGTLSNERVSCPEMRKAVLDIIYPSPSLASSIEENCKELERSNWLGLIPNLWPNAKYVCTTVTGPMRPYLKKLRHYARDLPLVTQFYAASESYVGINSSPCSPPETASYTMVPTVSYYEFIPLYEQEGICISENNDYIEDKPIPLSQVKVGQKYEIVLTTYSGLYRYKLGDVVEVVGFYKNTPKLNFIHRRNLLLCVASEKTTEESLNIVVERGSEVLISRAADAELVDFTSHANVTDQPGHYEIYWEIKGDGIEDSTLQECCTEMDAMFPYRLLRTSGDIGPLELCIVERGTFVKIFDYFVENGGTVNQFKTPKCTNNQGVLKILMACTVNRFRSTAYNG